MDCTEHQQCSRTKLAIEYRGMAAVSVSGQTCMAWSSLRPALLSYIWRSYDQAMAAAAGNYCRNPDGDIHGLWCYVDAASEVAEYCAVPRCGECIGQFVYLLLLLLLLVSYP